MSSSIPSRRRITLTDVAREAGVSVQTASHVMSGNMTVRLPETTRERVRQAAAKVGYQPNRLAQAMRMGRSHMVSVWIPLDRVTPNYMKILKAISEHSQQDGYDTMVVGLSSSFAYNAEGRTPFQWPVDGVIGADAGRAMRKFRENPANDSTPIVVLGMEEYTNGDAVGWDVVGSAYEVTQRMIAKGAKRIVHATLPWVLQDYPNEQRRRGYSEAMVEAGLIPEFAPVDGEASRQVEVSAREWINANGIPDAIFGFTDSIAIGFARALLDAGVRIPEQCMVWGFSDYPEAEDFRVPISSVRAPFEQVVAHGWKWLIDRIENSPGASRSHVYPMEIVERESSLVNRVR